MQTLEANRWHAAILISSVLLAVFSAASDSNNKLSETDENAIRQWRADCGGNSQCV
jgi:hypothetical protein